MATSYETVTATASVKSSGDLTIPSLCCIAKIQAEDAGIIYTLDGSTPGPSGNRLHFNGKYHEVLVEDLKNIKFLRETSDAQLRVTYLEATLDPGYVPFVPGDDESSSSSISSSSSSISSQSSSSSSSVVANSMRFGVQTASASETFTLPVSGATLINMVVDWGDGNQDTITSTSDPELTHTYASSGTYDVEISGSLNWFRFNNGGDKTKVVSLTSLGDIGLVEFDMYGCSNLASWTVDCLTAAESTLTNLYQAFRSCSSVTATSFPAIPFGVTTLQQTFQACSSVTATSFPVIPSSVTNMQSTFYGCSSVTASSFPAIPSGVTSLYQTFYNCSSVTATSFPAIPSGVTSLSEAFTSCSSVTASVFPTIPSSVTTLYRTFYNCSSVTASSFPAIPSGVTTLYQAFYGCSSVTASSFPAIPSGVTNAQSALQNCSSVTTVTTEFDGATSCTNYTDTVVGTSLTAGSVDNMIEGIDGTGVTGGTLDYSTIIGDTHLDSARSGSAAAAITNLISTKGWVRVGSY